MTDKLPRVLFYFSKRDLKKTPPFALFLCVSTDIQELDWLAQMQQDVAAEAGSLEILWVVPPSQ